MLKKILIKISNLTVILTIILSLLLCYDICSVIELKREIYGLSLYVQKIKVEPVKENVDFERLQRANVFIICGKYGGSGTVIALEDYIYILTARHIVTKEKETDKIKVEIPIIDKNVIVNDEIWGKREGIVLVEVNPDTDIVVCDNYDLALIRIKNFPGHELSILLPASRNPKLGDMVYTIGNPFSLVDVITQGIYTGSRNFDGLKEDLIYDGITFGCSGGAVVNDEGKLIGIIFAISSNNSHLGLIVPRKQMINFVVKAYEEFKTLSPVKKIN